MRTALVMALAFICNFAIAGEVGEHKKPECPKLVQKNRNLAGKTEAPAIATDKKESAKK